MDYVDIGLAALTAPPARDSTGSLVPQEGPGLLAMVGAGVVGALAILGIGAALSPSDPMAEQMRVETLTKLGYNPYAPEPLNRTLDRVKERAEGARWGLSVPQIHANLDDQLIREALQVTGGNRTHAARLLNRSRRWLLYRLKDYRIRAEDYERRPSPQLELAFKPPGRAPVAAAPTAPPEAPSPVIRRAPAPPVATVPDMRPGGEPEAPMARRCGFQQMPEVLVRRRGSSIEGAEAAHEAVAPKKGGKQLVTPELRRAAMAAMPTFPEDEEEFGPLLPIKPTRRG